MKPWRDLSEPTRRLLRGGARAAWLPPHLAPMLRLEDGVARLVVVDERSDIAAEPCDYRGDASVRCAWLVVCARAWAVRGELRAKARGEVA